MSEKTGNYEAALSAYKRVLGDKPWKNQHVWISKIRMEKQLQQFNKAVEDYLEVITMEPIGVDWQSLYADLESCLVKAGRKKSEPSDFMNKLKEKQQRIEETRHLLQPHNSQGDFLKESGRHILAPDAT